MDGQTDGRGAMLNAAPGTGREGRIICANNIGGIFALTQVRICTSIDQSLSTLNFFKIKINL